MQQLLVIIVLLLLIGAAAVALLLDARHRRIDRQVEIALSQTQVQSIPSIRRARVESRWAFLHRLANGGEGIALRCAKPRLCAALPPRRSGERRILRRTA